MTSAFSEVKENLAEVGVAEKQSLSGQQLGSASRAALAVVARLLAGPVAENVASELLAVAAQLHKNQQLVSALTEPAPHEAKTALVNSVYRNLTAATRNILVTAATQSWSNTAELVSGVETLGIRAAAAANPVLDEELISVANTIDSNHELELNIGSKLIAPAVKEAAVEKLFAGKLSASVVTIVKYIVANPAGRKISPTLRAAARLAADQVGHTLAEVTAVTPLDAQRSERLRQVLARIAGRQVKISTVIDPTLVGGLRVQIGDEIIDGSVIARLHDLRLQLAG